MHSCIRNVSEEFTVDSGNTILFKPVDSSFLLNIIKELFHFFLYAPPKKEGGNPQESTIFVQNQHTSQQIGKVTINYAVMPGSFNI